MVASPYTARRVRAELAEAVDVITLVDDPFRYQLVAGAWDPSRLSGEIGEPVEASLNLGLDLTGLRSAAAKSGGLWIATDPDRRGEWLAREIGLALADVAPARRMPPRLLQRDALEQAMESADDPAGCLAEAYRAERIIRQVTGLRLMEDLSGQTRLERFVGIDQLMALELLARREWDLIKGRSLGHERGEPQDVRLTTAGLIVRAARDLGMAPRAAMTAARWLYDLGSISFPWTDPVTNPEIHVSDQPPGPLPLPPHMGLVWPSESDHLDLYAMLSGAEPDGWRMRRPQTVLDASDVGPRFRGTSLIRALDERALVRSDRLASAIHPSVDRGLITSGSRLRRALPHMSALSPSLMGLALARYVHSRFGARLDSAAFAGTLTSVDELARGRGHAEQVMSEYFHGSADSGSPGLLDLIADTPLTDPEDWSTFVFHGEHLTPRRPRGMISGACVVAGKFGPYARHGQLVAHLDEQIAPAELTKSTVVEALGLSAEAADQPPRSDK